jgi:hypothetical protein
MQVEARGLVEGADGVGVSGPQGDSIAGAGAEGEVEAEAIMNLVEDFSAIDGLGPGFEVGEFNRVIRIQNGGDGRRSGGRWRRWSNGSSFLLWICLGGKGPALPI